MVDKYDRGCNKTENLYLKENPESLKNLVHDDKKKKKKKITYSNKHYRCWRPIESGSITSADYIIYATRLT